MIGGTDAIAGVVTIAPSDASGNPLDGARGGPLNSLMMSRGGLMLMAGDRSKTALFRSARPMPKIHWLCWTRALRGRKNLRESA